MLAHAACVHGSPRSAAVLCIARRVRMTASTDRLHTLLFRIAARTIVRAKFYRST
jgi:hypothetical protein